MGRRDGLDGDAHQHDYVHGGPHRAVSLLGNRGDRAGPGRRPPHRARLGRREPDDDRASSCPGCRSGRGWRSATRLVLELGGRGRAVRRHQGLVPRRQVRPDLDPAPTRPTRGCTPGSSSRARSAPATRSGVAARGRIGRDGLPPARAPRRRRSPALARDVAGRRGGRLRRPDRRPRRPVGGRVAGPPRNRVQPGVRAAAWSRSRPTRSSTSIAPPGRRAGSSTPARRRAAAGAVADGPVGVHTAPIQELLAVAAPAVDGTGHPAGRTGRRTSERGSRRTSPRSTSSRRSPRRGGAFEPLVARRPRLPPGPGRARRSRRRGRRDADPPSRRLARRRRRAAGGARPRHPAGADRASGAAAARPAARGSCPRPTPASVSAANLEAMGLHEIWRRRNLRYTPGDGPVSEMLRGRAVRPGRRRRARHARPPRGPQRVQRLADRRAPDDVRGPRPRVADGAPGGRPRRRRPVVLRRRRHRLDARGDGPRRRGQRAGRDGDGRDVRDDRHLPGPRHRPRPGRGARRRDGPLRGRRPRHRRGRDEVRVHRDAPRDPAGGDLAVRDREDRRVARPGAVPGRSPVRRVPGQRIGLVHEVVEGEEALDDGRGPASRRHPRRPARRRRAPRRRSSARCAGSATGRRSGTPRG